MNLEYAAGGRGRTTVADRVIEKIASQAADEITLSAAPPSRVHSAGLRRMLPPRKSRPRVEASVDGRMARLSVTMSVPYPAPIREVAGQVRSHVISTVSHLTGVDVREVDIEIAALPRAAAPGRVQ